MVKIYTQAFQGKMSFVTNFEKLFYFPYTSGSNVMYLWRCSVCYVFISGMSKFIYKHQLTFFFFWPKSALGDFEIYSIIISCSLHSLQYFSDISSFHLVKNIQPLTQISFIPCLSVLLL